MSHDLDPDSREYRTLVQSGRMAVLSDLALFLAQRSERMDVAPDDEALLTVMTDNWRELISWMEEAGDEVRSEMSLLKGDTGQ